MKCSDGVVTFKSTYKWFYLEREGTKPNTVQLLESSEWRLLEMERPLWVRVVCVYAFAAWLLMRERPRRRRWTRGGRS